MIQDILQVFYPNNKLIQPRSITCGNIELKLIELMNQRDSNKDCEYFFNGHRTETRDELKVLLNSCLQNNQTELVFHGYKLNIKLNPNDFEYTLEGLSTLTQNLATFLNIYDERTVREFQQCFQMMEKKFGWQESSLEHFLSFWSIAEINNIPNTNIGNRLRQWQSILSQNTSRAS